MINEVFVQELVQKVINIFIIYKIVLKVFGEHNKKEDFVP